MYTDVASRALIYYVLLHPIMICRSKIVKIVY